jgi:hypothetical protein
MPQPDVFSLIRSELNDFLFAPIGVEQNGMTLSVISGLARLGVDPWAEAARLAGLPGPAAIAALAGKIGEISGGSWKADAGRIAERLIRLLPQGAVAPPPTQAPANARAPTPASQIGALKAKLRAPGWLIWVLLAALAVATLAGRETIFGGRNDAPAQSTDERP